MPDWYVYFSQIAADENCPPDLHEHALAMLQYVDDLRRDYRQLHEARAWLAERWREYWDLTT